MAVIVGIDWSLTSTGVAIIRDGTVLGTHRIKPKAGVRGDERVKYIRDTLIALLHRYKPDYVGIEGAAFAVRGRAIVQLFGLYGVLRAALFELGYDYYIVAPTARAKYATGKGNSSKDIVVQTMRALHPGHELATDDEADALAIACIGSRRVGQPVETSLPEGALTALTKVQWDGKIAA